MPTTATPAPAVHRQSVPLPPPDAIDSDEQGLELINAWHEEHLARISLDELLESGALAALFA